MFIQGFNKKAGIRCVGVWHIKERKVRILNGAHTASFLTSYLGGINIIRDMMHDRMFGKTVRQIVDSEIVPMVPLPADDVKSFADSVYDGAAEKDSVGLLLRSHIDRFIDRIGPCRGG